MYFELLEDHCCLQATWSQHRLSAAYTCRETTDQSPREESLQYQSSMEFSRKVASASPDPSVFEVREKHMNNPCANDPLFGVELRPPKFESYRTSSIDADSDPVNSNYIERRGVPVACDPSQLNNNCNVSKFQRFSKVAVNNKDCCSCYYTSLSNAGADEIGLGIWPRR